MLAKSSDHPFADNARRAAWLPVIGVTQLIMSQISAWHAVCAAYYAAAARYEQLNRLSVAELHRRGLPRETLARDVCETSDRSKPLDPKTMTFW
jgi:hypothetical protein